MPKSNPLDIPTHYLCQTRKGTGKKWNTEAEILANDAGRDTAIMWLAQQPNLQHARVQYGKRAYTLSLR